MNCTTKSTFIHSESAVGNDCGTAVRDRTTRTAFIQVKPAAVNREAAAITQANNCAAVVKGGITYEAAVLED
jgi:hypothetical protein